MLNAFLLKLASGKNHVIFSLTCTEAALAFKYEACSRCASKHLRSTRARISHAIKELFPIFFTWYDNMMINGLNTMWSVSMLFNVLITRQGKRWNIMIPIWIIQIFYFMELFLQSVFKTIYRFSLFCFQGKSSPWLYGTRPLSKAFRSCSQNYLIAPRTKLTSVGDRPFQFHGPWLWNSLPPEVRVENDFNSLKFSFKTFLYEHSLP